MHIVNIVDEEEGRYQVAIQRDSVLPFARFLERSRTVQRYWITGYQRRPEERYGKWVGLLSGE